MTQRPSDVSTHYTKTAFSVGLSSGGFRSQRVMLDVCNLCGAVVGNRPAHDVFCYSGDGPDAANYAWPESDEKGSYPKAEEGQ